MYGLIEQFKNIFTSGGISISFLGYRIIRIEEEKVPLAPGPGSPYFYPMLGAMVFVLLLLLTMIYGILCYKYRRRIAELNAERTRNSGWNLWKLKELVLELEAEEADRAMVGISF